MKNDLHQLLSRRVSRISFFAALEFQRGPVGGFIVTYGSPLSILIFEHHVAGDPLGGLERNKLKSKFKNQNLKN